MRAAIWLVLLTALAVTLALSAQSFSGYVSIFIERERIDLSLALAALLLALGFVLFYAFLRTVAWTIRLPERVRRYRVRRQSERARHWLEQSLQHGFEGRYGRAQRAALSIAAESDLAAYGQLIATHNALALQQLDQAAQALDAAELAAQTHGQTQLHTALVVARAQLLLAQQQPHAAAQFIRQLHRQGARVTLTYKLLMQAEHESGNTQAASRIAQQLLRRKMIDQATAQRMNLPHQTPTTPAT